MIGAALVAGLMSLAPAAAPAAVADAAPAPEQALAPETATEEADASATAEAPASADSPADTPTPPASDDPADAGGIAAPDAEPPPPRDEFASVEPIVATPETVTPATATPAATPADDRPQRPPFPRVVVAVGPAIGPHAIGNQECRDADKTCVTAGGFFGMGLNAEVRASAYKALYFHARGLLVANVSPKNRDPLYRGLWGLGVGAGAYGRRIFARAEYLFVDAFGDAEFTPPFHTEETGSDVWGHHAGLLSVGFRLPFGERMAVELWGGPMIGPSSRREVPPAPAEKRVLPTFVLGFNLTFDALR